VDNFSILFVWYNVAMSRFLKYKVRSKTTQQIRKEKDNPTRCEICDVLGKELKRGLCKLQLD
jgi:hypothetical protein